MKNYLLILLTFLILPIFGQVTDNLPITLPCKDLSIDSVFAIMKQQQNIAFSYNNNLLVDKVIHFEKIKLTVAEIVIIISAEVDVNYKIQGMKVILYPKKKKFTLSGTIKDDFTGESIPGTYIRLKGTNYGVETNENGHFEIRLEAGDYDLEFSFIGYKTIEKTVTLISESELNILLSMSTNSIEEVKVTKQRDFWGNLSTGRNINAIDSKKIDLQNFNNAAEILQASAPGVWSSQTSGAPGDHQKVLIRGLSSIFGCSDPLYIIDGVAVPIVNLHSLGIGDLNINDIEKVTILKDAASTALYGYQGANGVVIIDTKRNNDNHISFSAKIGFQQPPKKYDLMNTKDFLATLDSAKKNSVSKIRGFYPDYSDTLQNTDWQNIVFRKGVIHEYQLSGSGNIGKTSFYLSGNYYSNEGIMTNSNFKRYTFMANIGRNLTRKLSANLNVRSSFQKNVNNLDLYHGNDLIINAINKSPCFNSTPDSLYYVLLYGYELLPAVRTFMSGNSRTLFGDSLSAGQLIKNTMNTLDASVNSVNLAGKYMISENLFINASSSATFRNNYYNSFNYIYPYERVVYSNDVIGGYTEVYFKSSEHYILLNQQLSINYFKNFNKHDIKCTIGYRNYADNANWKLDSIYNKGDYGDQSWYSDYYFSYLKSPLASNANSGSITRLIQSFAANLNYNYNRKYYLSFILNRENLKVNDLVNISNWFPSVAINWDISKEQIFTRPGWLNQFNLYGNWGRSGNYPVNALADNKYSEYQYTFNDTITNGKSVTQFANHHLKSEISNEYNAGTNLNLFNNRIILTADYYTKINSGLIIMRDIPYYYLGGTMMYNIGKISNHGWEFNLELEPVRTKNFNWYSVFAISFNRQKVINIGNEEQINFNSTDILFPDMVISENQALGNILGYKYLGEWTAKDNADNKHQVNSNGSKYLKVDTTTYDINHKDKIILGKSIPDYTWNWSNTFRYKNFFIDLLWYGVMGVSKFNSTKASTYMACTNREVTEFMQPGRKTLTDTVFYQSSYFVENASFIRLKRATISYLIPRKIFKYGDIKLSLSFENVFTFTHYTGYDPEASIYTNNSFSDFAVDRGAYPNPRSIFFTIKLEL